MSTMQKKIFTWILVCVMAFTSIVSVLFVAAAAGHQCRDDHCPVCVQINQIFRIYKGNGLQGMQSLHFAQIFILGICCIGVPLVIYLSSPVLNKVRMNH